MPDPKKTSSDDLIKMLKEAGKIDIKKMAEGAEAENKNKVDSKTLIESINRSDKKATPGSTPTASEPSTPRSSISQSRPSSIEEVKLKSIFKPAQPKNLAPPPMLSEMIGLSPEQRAQKMKQNQETFDRGVKFKKDQHQDNLTKYHDGADAAYQKAYDAKYNDIMKMPKALSESKLSQEDYLKRRSGQAVPVAVKEGNAAREAYYKQNPEPKPETHVPNIDRPRAKK